MKKIIYITILIFILFSACKTTENTSLHIRKNIEEDYDPLALWENGLDLTNANLDSLYELYKDMGYTLEDWENAKLKGMRWTEKGFSRYFFDGEGEVKAGDMLHEMNSVVIFPNPTSSSVSVDIIKKITVIDGETGQIIPHPFDLSWCFPFDVTLKLILDEKIVWTYRNPYCNGTEIIDANVLQKAGNYQLVVEIDGISVSNNFIVIKK
jgi:hypothetical protein